MGKKIHKYEVAVNPKQVIELPQDARILTVQVQEGSVYIWAELDDNAEMTKHFIHVVGTGHPIPANCAYLGTVQMPPFVWHLYIGDYFEVKNLNPLPQGGQ